MKASVVIGLQCVFCDSALESDLNNELRRIRLIFSSKYESCRIIFTVLKITTWG
jgi:hypothetical protein